MFDIDIADHTWDDLVADVKKFADEVSTKSGIEDVYLYMGTIHEDEQGGEMRARPLLWVYAPPIV